MEDSFFNLGNEAFTLTGYKCKATFHEEADGKIITTVRSDPQSKLHYAFSGEKGLCLTTPFGTILESDLLGKFISIRDDPYDYSMLYEETIHFCEEYGFLFPIGEKEEMVLDAYPFYQLFERLKTAALLQSALNDIKFDYEKILLYTFYLALSSRVNFSMGSRGSYSSSSFHVIDLIDDPLMPTLAGEDFDAINDRGTFSVADTMFPPSYDLDVDEYNEIISGESFLYNYPGIKDSRYRKLVALYKNAHSETRNNRKIIDFLFHFMHDVGVVKFVTYNRGILYYSSTPNTEKLNQESFRQALLEVARLVLSQEINYNVSRMKPVFSPVTMKGTWKAPYLLTALYFSLFYRSPGEMIYKRCANPSCPNFVEVAITNTRKKYCCDSCRNAKNQRDHRLRQKKENT